MRRLTLLALAFAFLSTVPALAALPKACDLLSTNDVAKIWGGPVAAGVDRGKKGTDCFYDREHDEWVWLVLVDASGWGANSQKLFGILAGGGPNSGAEAVGNLGEGSFYNAPTAGSNDSVLKVLYHGAYMTITARRSKNPHIKEDMIQAARQMLAKF